MESTPEPKVRCPEFLPGFTWLNTSRPLTVSGDLRGRVALLDFWTYCCINCMHVLPVLRRIEERFRATPFVVVGVHSAKFISERDPRNIRSAIRRYGITHPVVVDSEHDIWERFAVRAWPTLVLVDAEGYVRETLSGEPNEETLAAKIAALLDEGRARGVLAEGPLDLEPETQTGSTLLRFPGKVHAAEERLYIADTNHNRILIAGLDGTIAATIGEGGAGAHDGPAREASFCGPQGLVTGNGRLYVADTANHMIREVDLASLDVGTIAGTGRKGEGPGRYDPLAPRTIPLRSPWALALVDTHLLIAMAGSHELWAFSVDERRLGVWAGSGREDHVDGPLREAAFAQPSGLARSGRFLFVADSEVSSVRAIDIEAGSVLTVVGRGLFDFGDRDGVVDRALLQHPLDVAVDGAALYVADTYNNKIKTIDLATMTVRTLFGDGDPAILNEPGGIAVWDGALFIADTNNHRLLRGDPRTGRLEEIVLQPPVD